MESGIYKIVNLVNQKIYIGSATNLHTRWLYNHLRQLRKNIHYNPKLQSAFNKYGEENFKFEIIEHCGREKLIEREQFYIDTLKPHFNICKTAGSTLNKSCSEEQKLVLSNHFKGRSNPKNRGPKSEKTKEKIRAKLKGIKRSPESIEGTRLGLTGKPKSKDHIEKVRQANLNRKKKSL